MSATEIRLAGEIEQLRQRVARLEKGRQQHTEQNVPNYLTTKADGSVGALFTGGLQLLEALVAGYQPSNSVAWLDAGGVMREFLQGQGVPPLHQMQVFSEADATDTAGLRIQTLELGAGGSSTVTAFANDNAGNAASKKIIDSLTRSSYAQLDGAKLSTVGTGTLTWPGGSAFSNALNVKLPGATGSVQLIGTAQNNLGVGVSVLAAPDGAGGSNVQGFASAAPALNATDVFSFLQWGT